MVGLTGSMGSGKTSAGKIFQELGAEVLEADKVCRDLVLPNLPAWNEIVQSFGEEILNPDQTLNREKLGAAVFVDDQKKARLESILHPKVFEEEKKRFEILKTGNPKVILIVDAPLLMESGNHENMDKVIVVAADEKTQIERLAGKSRWTHDEVARRIAQQMPLKEKIKKADYIINNDSSVDRLRFQVNEVFQELESMAKGP